MPSIRSLLFFALLGLAAYTATIVDAHSQRPNPLSRIAYASDASIDVVRRSGHPTSKGVVRRSSPPAHVLSSDSIRLSLRGFNQTFHLHLEPNDEIVPQEGATLNVWGWDEREQREVLEERRTIARESVRAYRGVVVHPEHSARRMYEDSVGVSRRLSGLDEQEGVMGHAAIMLHDDGDAPRFEGLFDWRGNQHTIQTARTYHAGRHHLDPALHRRSMDLNHLVIHRDSDLLTDFEMERAGLAVRDVTAPTGCTHDGHDYNANNHLFLTDDNNDEWSKSPLDFFALPATTTLGRRAWFDPREPTSSFSPLWSRGLASPDFSYDVPLVRRQDALGNGANNSFVSSIGNTQGCPKSAMVVYIGMAADCSFTQANGGSVSNTSTTLLNVINSVSTTYRNTFNVSLGVVELDVRQPTCPSSANASVPWNTGCSAMTIDDRLSAFSEWRGAQSANGTGLWHLITGCGSSGENVGEIGVAWLGTLCKTDTSKSGSDTVSGTGVTSNTNRNAQVVAHEIGHNFGLVHDCMSGCTLSGSTARQSNSAVCCPQSSSNCNDADAHIMSPVAARNTMSFSPCSIGNMCTMLGGGLNTNCVTKPGSRNTLSTQQCGNGILEPGEECDAGANGSRCCSSECKLTSGSQCDPTSTACCTDSCQFAAASKLCRAAKDNSGCDTAEYCTGSSADCPADEYKENGSSCGSGGLQCANGVCTSRDQQCRSQTSSSGSGTFDKACSVRSDQSCSLACQDDSNPGTCTLFQTNFIDGTACGYGGFCEGGECKSSGWQDTFKGWYRNNLNIAIPVTIVVAIIVIAILWGLLRCCFGGRTRSGAKPAAAAGGWRRGRRSNGPVQPPPMRNSGAPASAAPPGGPYGYQNVASNDYPSYAAPSGPPPPVPARRSQGYQRQSQSGWVDATQWNGR